MTKKLQRTIYIGAGGTGIETVLKVRNYFKGLTKNGTLPPMIKCLFIDTDENEVNNLDRTVTNDEIMRLSERNAKAIYLAHQKDYSTYTNTSRIRALANGAGQIRSLGRFSIMCKENSAGKGNVQEYFSQKFQALYNEIMNIRAGQENPEFETMGNNVEIHLAFSMSGGTGAGTFLSLAYLIRQIVPQCKIIAYAFAPSFFMNLPVKEQIQQNTYASLLELDYCMSADDPAYQDIKYPAGEKIERAPFDVFMYVDNKTYTANGSERQHVYIGEKSKYQVEMNVAQAMAVSAGDMGAGNKSVLDNWIDSINSGNYDVDFSGTGEHKRAWVSSLGVSEIVCEPSIEQSFFATNLSLRILKALSSNGRPVESASATAYSWVKELDINENGENEDHNAVVNAIISPDEFYNMPAREIDQNNVESGRQIYFKRVNKSITQDAIDKRKNKLLSSKKKELVEKVTSSIFKSGNDNLSISDTISILKSFAKYMSKYAAILGNDLNDRQADLELDKRNWGTEKDTLNRVTSSMIHFNRAAAITESEGNLRYLAQKWFENEVEIHRIKEAIDFFDKMCTFANEVESSLSNLLVKVESAITEEENAITSVNVSPVISTNSWGTIDVTKKAHDLPSVDASTVTFDLSAFFASTGYDSIFDLSSQCDDFASLTENFTKNLFDENKSAELSIYPIVRVVKSLSEKERNEYLKPLAIYSVPLMEVQDYGEDVKTTQHICVAIPDGINGDPQLMDIIKKALNATNNIKWVDINDPNRIIIYRQIGVIPPYFIDGISKGKHSISLYNSCQEAFERKDNPQAYNPFTDTQFDAAYHKWGFSLDSNKRDTSGDILLWVKAMALSLITNNGPFLYKIESETGEIDMDDPQWRKFKVIEGNRHEAFMAFCEDKGLCAEIESKIDNMMKQPEQSKKWDMYKGNRALYGNTFINRESEEWQIPEVKKQCQDEMMAL